jgi:hypothetical protein
MVAAWFLGVGKGGGRKGGREWGKARKEDVEPDLYRNSRWQEAPCLLLGSINIIYFSPSHFVNR